MPRRKAAEDNGTVGVAPRNAILESLEDDDEPVGGEVGRTMHEILTEAGAKLDRNGTYYRIVADGKKEKQVVIRDGKRFIATETIRRDVAVGLTPQEASRNAILAKGAIDSFWPGIGWLRGGVKAETEHPSNVGILAQTSSGRIVLEEIEDDVAQTEQALAIRNVLQAQQPTAAPAAAPIPAPEAPPMVSVIEGEEE